ncbi:MAG: DUF4363 family protein [Clostridia bacterium]|nr:DUF4363 family protein [Clostridia bacterium]
MKEITISILIIISIFIGNFITQNYTNYATEHTSKQLSSLKEIMVSNEENIKKDLEDKVDKIHEEWDEKYEKLAYYIEHNELEKIESGLTLVRSYIETEEYTESIGKVDETIYLLRHLEDKNKFSLKNIF